MHFPPSWTEQAKENWFANLRDKNEDETPPGMPTVYITGIYGASGNVPRVDSEWDGSLPAGLDRGSQGSMADINRRPVWFAIVAALLTIHPAARRGRGAGLWRGRWCASSQMFDVERGGYLVGAVAAVDAIRARSGANRVTHRKDKEARG